MLDHLLSQAVNKQSWNGKPHKSGFPLAPIVASIVGVLVWLIFILFFALFWSKGYNLFQDIVVLLATLFIAALVIGLMWIIWGRNQWHWWTREYTP
jgi:amino acid transporter